MWKKFFFFIKLSIIFNVAIAQDKLELTTVVHEDFLSKDISCFMKDSKGFLWIGSGYSLMRYDGYEFIEYKHTKSDTNSISNNMINKIIEDKDSNLWIATNNALNLCNWEKNNFTYFIHDSSDENSISNNWIRSLYLDKNGDLWIGTREGLNKLMKNKHGEFIFQRYYPVRHDYSNTNEWSINSICEDLNGNMWIGTWGGGLQKFNRETGHFEIYKHDPADPYSINGNIVANLVVAKNGFLWMSVFGKGINVFDPVTKKSYHAGNDIDIKKHFGEENIVYDVYSSKENLIWVGGSQGIYCYDPVGKKLIPTINYEDHDIFKDFASAFYEDNTGIIWIGYLADGIEKYDPHRDKFSKWYVKVASKENFRDYIKDIIYQENNSTWLATYGDGLLEVKSNGEIIKRYLSSSSQGSLSNDMIQTLALDNQGYIWIGTKNGLNKFDQETGKVVAKFFHDDKNNTGLIHDAVYDLCLDATGMLWVVTQEGLNKIDPSREIIIEDPVIHKIQLKKITGVYQDRDGEYWFAGKDGLAWLKKENELIHFYSDFKNLNSISDNEVRSVHQDLQGIIWIGTQNGLTNFDKKSGIFKSYYDKDGLYENTILMITDDNRGNLWLKTTGSLSKMNVKDETFKNYLGGDGLSRKTFELIKDSSGIFLLPREKGFYAFYPDSIKENLFVPPVYFTEFKISGKTIPAGSKLLGGQSIFFTPKIELDYHHNILKFKFSALNYTLSDKNQYAYKIEGYDTSWNYIGTKNEFTLMNMKAGKYKIMLKGSNNDAVWNEEPKSISLVINPPWWLTWWAYLIYAVTILTLLLIYRKVTITAEQRKAEIELERVNAQKTHEIDKMKLSFFINVSHELKTPLTLIQGPVERILENEKSHEEKIASITDKLDVVRRNTKRLLNLINQLLDVRRIEVGKLKAEVIEGDIIKFVKRILPSFSSHAELNDIYFKTTLDQEENYYWFDPDKLEKILSNLLSNSFKHTPKKGEIDFSATYVKKDSLDQVKSSLSANMKLISKANLEKSRVDCLNICVSDTGTGMNEGELDKIFERFYQVNNNSKYSMGSGIGLSLAKELVELLHGEIYVKSSMGKGASFVILLPVEKKSFDGDEIMEAKPYYEEFESPRYMVEHLVDKEEDEGELETKKDDKQIILVVEDNRELLNFISDLLEEDYIVKKAKNGKEGLEKAKKHIPDLIISDIMMPGMDGMELCHHFKNDEYTSHIPIILLTAKSGKDSITEAFEEGADEYITKPFSPGILRARVANLIETRKNLRKKFSKSANSSLPKEIEGLTNNDELFFQKALKIVEKHISDSNFNRDDFCNEIGMSASQLYRKINGITGYSINEFIRIIRLKKAASVLQQNSQLTISELAYMVGFSSPNYFSRAFRAFFGVTPSEYSENPSKIKNEDNDSANLLQK